MRLFYWKSPAGNFGDDLNQWLWDDLLPGWREDGGGRWLIGVGTVLNSLLLPSEGDPSFLVLGSGVGFGRLPELRPADRWDVRFVRGPLTARALGLSPQVGIIDPAALAVRLPRFASVPATGRVVFIPHCHSDLDPDYDWPVIASEAGLFHLSPRGDSEAVIREIAGARLVITESMHGAIIADAFRVPWQPVSLVGIFNEFKWHDWGESLGLKFRITPLPSRLRRLRNFSWEMKQRARAALGKARSRTEPPPVRGESRLVDALRRAQGEQVSRLLARLARMEPFLSTESEFHRQADRAEAVLAKTARDYGLACARTSSRT